MSLEKKRNLRIDLFMIFEVKKKPHLYVMK